jgi:fimbrial chaperone protein
MPAWITCFLAMCLLATATTAVAGSFSISPLRVELASKKRIEALTVRNEQDSEVVIQAVVQEWTQVNGQDMLTATHDAFATPAVFTLPGKGVQVVRVALRRDADNNRELTYRLLLQEVPPAAPKDFTGLQVSLRLSLPIFVTPTSDAKSALTWHAKWSNDGKLTVDAVNTGTAHLQVMDFTLQFGDQAINQAHQPVSKYVLPGSRMTWTVTPPAEASRTAAMKAHVYSDQGEFDADVATGP